MRPSFSVLLVGYVGFLSAQLPNIMSAQQTYSVILSERTVDAIVLQCRNNTTLIDVNLQTHTEVVFFVNDTVGATSGTRVLGEIPGVELIRTDTGASFKITRDIEGYYSCGPRGAIPTPTDLLFPLISYDTSGLPVNMRRTYAVQSRDSTTLHCPYEPGRLQSCYFGHWSKDGHVIVSVGIPATGSCNPKNTMVTDPSTGKYQLNRETFALTINDLHLSDSGTYKCQLELLNPASQNGETRSFPGNTPLLLIVDGEPSITRGPTEVVIGVDSRGENLSQNAMFTCTAIGLPVPEISWFYFTISTEGELGDEPRQLTSNIIVTGNSTEDSGRIVITHQISVPVTDRGGGVIRCQTGSVYEDARLTVLGRPRSIGITVTTRREIIYEIELSSHILHPVLLKFTYSNGRQELFRRNGPQPAEPYNNTRMIAYRENRDRLPPPCDECFVHVSLCAVVEGNLAQGLRASSILTIAELERQAMAHERNLTYGVISASVLGGIMLVAIIAVLLTSLYFKRKQNREANSVNDRNAILEAENREKRTENERLTREKEEALREKREIQQRYKDDCVIDNMEDLIKGFKKIKRYSDNEVFHELLEEFVEKGKKVIRIVCTKSDSEGATDVLQLHEDGLQQIELVMRALKCSLEKQNSSL